MLAITDDDWYLRMSIVMWSHHISIICYALSLLNLTTISWVLRCMAFIPQMPNARSCNASESKESFVCLRDLDRLPRPRAHPSLTFEN